MLFTVQLFPLLLFHMSTIFVRIFRTYRNKTKTRIFIDIYIYLYININNHDNIKLAWFAWCTISNWYTRTRRFVWLWATFSTLHFVLELRESEIRYRKKFWASIYATTFEESKLVTMFTGIPMTDSHWGERKVKWKTVHFFCHELNERRWYLFGMHSNTCFDIARERGCER